MSASVLNLLTRYSECVGLISLVKGCEFLIIADGSFFSCGGLMRPFELFRSTFNLGEDWP